MILRLRNNSFFTFFLLSSGLFAQTVTLDGKQFKDENGSDFYSVGMKYGVQIAHDVGSNVNYFAPNNHYHFTTNFECANQGDCYNKIESDLQNIKNMGFNTVHIFGVAPVFRRARPHPWTEIWTNIVPIDLSWPPPVYIFTQPYNSDPVYQMMLDGIADMIESAAGIGLKVIIEGQVGDSIPDQVTEDQYNELLAALATRMTTLSPQGKAALMAYNLMGEPLYNGDGVNRTKQSVCEMTTRWYNTIKSIDPDHLICSSGINFFELSEYDPGVSKIDFYMPHFYPNRFDWEDISPSQPDYNKMVDRIKGEIYWLGKYCPVPWMIGETGFAANDVTPITDPYMHGDLLQQQQYFQETMDFTRNCGGSGYMVWQYQDVFWINAAGTGWLDALSVIRHGDPANPANHKPAAGVFSNYLDINGNAPPVMPATMPANFYDPYNAAVVNTAHTNAVTGTLVDQNGNPIEGALIEAISWLETTDPNISIPGDEIYNNYWTYTFTKANGSFEVIPYNHVNPADHRITHCRGTAPGAERFDRGGWTDIQVSTNLGAITLSKKGLDFDESITSQFVPVSVFREFSGWNSVSVSNTVIDGTGTAGGASNITARNDIHITGEFHSRWGSETHVFLTETFADCNNFAAYAVRNSTAPFEENGKTITEESRLDLQFSVPSGFVIFPNPGTGKFTLRTGNLQQEKSVVFIKNSLGELVKEVIVSGNETEVNIPGLAPGIYFVELLAGSEKEIKKLIVN